MPDTLTLTTLPEDFVPTAPAIEMDDTDRRLLNILQEDFPLVSRPFAALGRSLEMTEEEVDHHIIQDQHMFPTQLQMGLLDLQCLQ